MALPRAGQDTAASRAAWAERHFVKFSFDLSEGDACCFLPDPDFALRSPEARTFFGS